MMYEGCGGVLSRCVVRVRYGKKNLKDLKKIKETGMKTHSK
jgi:hypothetical protein